MDLAQKAKAKAIRRTIEVFGTTTTYYEYPASAEDAACLVLIHGYRGNHRGLEAIAGGLSSFRVLIPDLPGFGESTPLQSSHNIENYSLWLGAFADQLGLRKKLNLVGHSFGTLIVGKYATTNQVNSISLINPISGPALSGPRSGLTRLTRAYYSLASALPESLGGLVLRNKLSVLVMSLVMAKTKNRKLKRWIHGQHLDNFSDFASVKVATEGYQASIASDLSSFAPLINSPVLIVAATLDDITDVLTQRTVHKMYPNAILREIAGVGHLVHYEAPEKAARFIEEFLQRQS